MTVQQLRQLLRIYDDNAIVYVSIAGNPFNVEATSVEDMQIDDETPIVIIS